MGLYLSLGMVVREHLINLYGTIEGKGNPEIWIERVIESDMKKCSRFCEKYYRAGRRRELNDAAEARSLFVAKEAGETTGLTTGIGFAGFSVALTNDVLQCLLIHQKTIERPGVLVPATNHSLIKWCLDSGMKINQSMNLMTLGKYEKPVASWLPSIHF